MTSFTRKLYLSSPSAAHDFYRAQQFEHRSTFGKRLVPPVQPAYECYMPDPRGFGSRPLKPKSVIFAGSSFEARQQYARHHGLAITDVVALRLYNETLNTNGGTR